jgi:HEAT repeat protein
VRRFIGAFLFVAAASTAALAQPTDKQAQKLITDLESKDPELRRDAINTIRKSRMAIKSANKALVQVAENAKDPLRWAAMEVLAYRTSNAKTITPLLAKKLEERPVSLEILFTLQQLGPAGADTIPALVKAFREEKDSFVRDHILNTLGTMGTKATSFFLEALKDEKHRSRALYALAKVRAECKPCIPVLIDTTQSQSHRSHQEGRHPQSPGGLCEDSNQTCGRKGTIFRWSCCLGTRRNCYLCA